MRRIDIVLRFRDAIIGIENKPWAGDQDAQLIDYARYLESEAAGRDWILVYLCDSEPSVNSLPKEMQKTYEEEGRFIQCSFEQVEAWLDQCSKMAKALSVRVFIEELSKFVRIRVRGILDMFEEKTTTDIIIGSTKNIESAFDVFNSLVQVKIEILRSFRSELNRELNAKMFHLVWDDSMSVGWRSYSGFGVKFFERQNIYLRFEFEASDLNRLFWGFRRESEKVDYVEAKWNDINGRMSTQFGNGSSPRLVEPWWPWYRTDPENYVELDKNWWNNAKPWMQLKYGMKEKSVASHIASLAQEVKNAMGDDGIVLLQP